MKKWGDASKKGLDRMGFPVILNPKEFMFIMKKITDIQAVFKSFWSGYWWLNKALDSGDNPA